MMVQIKMLTLLTGSPSQPPAFLALRSSTFFIVTTVSLAIFTDLFLYAMIVPVLPFALTSRAGVAPDDVQTWVAVLLAVYGGALLCAAPVVGWLADRSESRRAPLLAGLLALAGSTVMLCVGSSIGVLVAGRVLQGASASVVWVVGLALLVDTVGPADIGVMMGYVGLAMSLAVVVAPLLGGVVFAASGYYQVFAMGFALIVLDVLLRVAMVEKKAAARWLKTEDERTEAREEAVEDATSEKRSRHDESSPSGCGSPNGEGDEVTELAPSVRGETEKIPDTREDVMTLEPSHGRPKTFIARLPPVFTLFASRRLLSALWASLMQATLLTAFDSILPIYVRDTFHWNSIGAGLIFLPIIIPTFVGPAVGWASDKYGPRYLSAAGFIGACPCIILLRLVDHDSLRQKVLMCALLALLGLTLTFALTPIMAEITYAVDAKAKRNAPGFFGKHGAYAQAYSLFNVAWAAGSLIGPLLGGFINEASGWPTVTLVLGIISAATTVPVLIWTGGSIFKKRRNEKEAAQASNP